MEENVNLGDDECLKAAMQNGNVQHYRLKYMECRIREGLKKKKKRGQQSQGDESKSTFQKE